MKLTSENFETTLKDNRLAIVDFWAQWCGPCRMLNPIMDKLEETYKGKVVIGKVNADEELDLSTRFSVRSIPTGEVVERFAGAGPERMYSEKLDYYLKGLEVDKKKEETVTKEEIIPEVVEEKK